jgi:hypothetical protein
MGLRNFRRPGQTDLHESSFANSLRSAHAPARATGSLLLSQGPPSWSKDGTCIYYQDILAPNQPVYSIRLSDHKRETVVTFEQFLRGSALTVPFRGLAPDGSIMAQVVRGDSDIYALDLDLP